MTAKDILSRFCEAFASKDPASLSKLFAPMGLFEFPLADQRLIGREEIEVAARRMFDGLDRVTFDLTKIKALPNYGVAEGKFEAKRIGRSEPVVFPMAIVVSLESAAAKRISVYLDAYGQRPWLDGRVFAAG
jgi:hypothetical protein